MIQAMGIKVHDEMAQESGGVTSGGDYGHSSWYFHQHN